MPSPRPFLNSILAFDAATCAVMGSGLVLGAGPLSAVLGMPPVFLSAAGLALIGFALLLGWVATRKTVAPSLVGLIVAGNVAWAAASLLLLAEGMFTLTPLGSAFVLAQALAVLLIAAAEYMGLRRLPSLAR
jgi:hypothetical protein